MSQHTLYILGGVARAGKSTVKEKMRERTLFVRPPEDDLCRPIVRHLFVKEMPSDAQEMAFEGVATYDSPKRSKTFDFSLAIDESIARLKEKNVLIELPTEYYSRIYRMKPRRKKIISMEK